MDQQSPTGIGLRSLAEARQPSELTALSDQAQERTLMAVLLVAIWAAVLPWLSGADAILCGALSVLAMAFPALFLLTAPSGRFRKVRGKGGGT